MPLSKSDSLFLWVNCLKNKWKRALGKKKELIVKDEAVSFATVFVEMSL